MYAIFIATKYNLSKRILGILSVLEYESYLKIDFFSINKANVT